MPCRDYQPSPETQRSIDNVKASYQYRLDELTSLLCQACSLLDELPPRLETWYTEHRKADLANMDELLCFANDTAKDMSKEDFDALDAFLTKLMSKY